MLVLFHPSVMCSGEWRQSTYISVDVHRHKRSGSRSSVCMRVVLLLLLRSHVSVCVVSCELCAVLYGITYLSVIFRSIPQER